MPPGEQIPPGVDTPRADTPRADTPWSRHAPWEQTPLEQTPPRSRPPRADTPRADTPLEQTPHLGADTPGADTPLEQTPPAADPPGSRLRHTVNERPVRILLECILVYIKEHNTEITSKLLAALQWILYFCKAAKFILKTYDYSYNNPALFVDFLLNTWGLPRHFIAGRCTLFRPNRDFYSKNYISYETYADLYFPVYCSGQAYVMPSKTLKQIYKTSMNVH